MSILYSMQKAPGIGSTYTSRYSGVQRGPNAYVPPAARRAQGSMGGYAAAAGKSLAPAKTNGATPPAQPAHPSPAPKAAIPTPQSAAPKTSVSPAPIPSKPIAPSPATQSATSVPTGGTLAGPSVPQPAKDEPAVPVAQPGTTPASGSQKALSPNPQAAETLSSTPQSGPSADSKVILPCSLPISSTGADNIVWCGCCQCLQAVHG